MLCDTLPKSSCQCDFLSVGIECLWARLDRKLNKDAGRKLKDYNRKKLEWLNSNHQVSCRL